MDCPKGITTFHTTRLDQESFEGFGTVIENPRPSVISSANLSSIPPEAVIANQGSALKYEQVSRMLDLYHDAPSQIASTATMNMFVCSPRGLKNMSVDGKAGEFHIEILERHPFTDQTFIPLGLSLEQAHEVKYVVIVAPSLPTSGADRALPVPSERTHSGKLPGAGLPNLSKIQAFVATGRQAVTYGAGTWHAPMVVIGVKPIDFVVVQFMNGVAVEDCQEVAIVRRHAGQESGLRVMIESPPRGVAHDGPVPKL